MRIKQLPPEVDENSMGKLMKQAGYDTFYGGKVHMCASLGTRGRVPLCMALEGVV
jgi:hypothetical protein